MRNPTVLCILVIILCSEIVAAAEREYLVKDLRKHMRVSYYLSLLYDGIDHLTILLTKF